jgi:hypothetical protein
MDTKEKKMDYKKYLTEDKLTEAQQEMYNMDEIDTALAKANASIKIRNYVRDELPKIKKLVKSMRK